MDRGQLERNEVSMGHKQRSGGSPLWICLLHWILVVRVCVYGTLQEFASLPSTRARLISALFQI